MGIDVRKATPDDAEACTRIGELAFQGDPFQSAAMKRDGATKEQLDEYWTWRVGRTKARLQRPGNHFFVAVDTGTGQVVGSTGMVAPEAVKPWPAIVVKSMFEERYAELEVVKKQLMGNREDFWYIPAMAVHPEYQRRGIGQALLRADIDLADAAGQDTYLESRPAAVKMYLSAGFECIGKIGDGEDESNHTVMLRKPRS